jgi:hypothetical protein
MVNLLRMLKKFLLISIIHLQFKEEWELTNAQILLLELLKLVFHQKIVELHNL